jgi:phosphohistidine phosphatase SixA
VPAFLIRHAHAGRRSAWAGDDQLRPLSARGADQAQGIALLLADRGITRVASSPATRCIETVEPLAVDLGLEVEIDKRLAEGSDPGDVVELVLKGAGSQALCAHGDLIPDVVAALVAAGMKAPNASRCQKGSVWEIDVDLGRAVRGRYRPPATRSD